MILLNLLRAVALCAVAPLCLFCISCTPQNAYIGVWKPIKIQSVEVGGQPNMRFVIESETSILSINEGRVQEATWEYSEKDNSGILSQDGKKQGHISINEEKQLVTKIEAEKMQIVFEKEKNKFRKVKKALIGEWKLETRDDKPIVFAKEQTRLLFSKNGQLQRIDGQKTKQGSWQLLGEGTLLSTQGIGLPELLPIEIAQKSVLRVQHWKERSIWLKKTKN